MRKPMLWLAAVLLGSLPTAAMATVKFVKWDKPHAGSRANVAALDLAARKVPWQVLVGKSVNFVKETSGGILVSTNEGTVVLLDASSGRVLWNTFLKKGEVNRFHAETEEGFLVSSGDVRFWLVDHAGKLLMHCEDQCLAK